MGGWQVGDAESSPTYVTAVDQLEVPMLAGGFFDGWLAAPTPAEHLHLLQNSSHVVAAVVEGAVIGFVNALSDGVIAAYIPLLEVLPECRGQGIGTELVRRLLSEIGPLYMVDVMCDADVLPFYERLGFQTASGGVMRNHAWRARHP